MSDVPVSEMIQMFFNPCSGKLFTSKDVTFHKITTCFLKGGNIRAFQNKQTQPNEIVFPLIYEETPNLGSTSLIVPNKSHVS